MPPSDPVPQSIRAVIGQNVARIRADQGINAETLAESMRTAGFAWAAQRVYELEAGRKTVSIAELLTLAAAISRSGEVVTVPDLMRSADLVPVSEDMGLTPADMHAALTGGPVVLSLTPQARQRLRGLAERASVAADVAMQDLAEWGLQDLDMDALDAVGAPDAADRKAATKLGVPVWVVQVTARRLWGRQLSAERDAEVDPGATAQARGHVTRALTEQLRMEIERRRGNG